jgi:hypothetical protein
MFAPARAPSFLKLQTVLSQRIKETLENSAARDAEKAHHKQGKYEE